MWLLDRNDLKVHFISKILYVETKESGPLGVSCAEHAPRSANVEESRKLEQAKIVFLTRLTLIWTLNEWLLCAFWEVTKIDHFFMSYPSAVSSKVSYSDSRSV